MEIEIRRISQECGERTGEVNHLCGLLDASGKERDLLQMEVTDNPVYADAFDVYVVDICSHYSRSSMFYFCSGFATVQNVTSMRLHLRIQIIMQEKFPVTPV